jgi:hypothetical protein
VGNGLEPPLVIRYTDNKPDGVRFNVMGKDFKHEANDSAIGETSLPTLFSGSYPQPEQATSAR